MKTIVNKTRRPLTIGLAPGHVLRLGPAKEGQIATRDVEHPMVQKMIAAGTLDVFDDATRAGARARSGPAGRAGSQGGHRQFSGSKRGDR